jgi:phage-related protein
MPRTQVVFFTEGNGSVPIVGWLDGLVSKAQIKCLAKLKRLEEQGHELRRPEADLLRDGIYELRVGLNGINYRILYFFHGKEAVVISHGITKEREVPHKEIELAIDRKARFKASPMKHTFEREV